MPKTERKVYVTERDRDMMGTLLERRVETLDWMHERFFSGCLKDTARHRLDALARARYIERMHFAHDDGGDHVQLRVAYNLRALGAAELVRCGRLNEAPTRETLSAPAANQIWHAVQCNRVGDLLREVAGGELDFAVSRRLKSMQRASRVRADASFLTLPDERGRSLVRIEVDLGNYRRPTITRKVSAFLADSSRAVWLVTPSEQRANQLRGWVTADFGLDRCRDVRVYTMANIVAGEVDHAVLKSAGRVGGG